MKTSNYLFIILLFLICTCNSQSDMSGQMALFGIHEIVAKHEIPASLIDTLRAWNVRIEENTEESIIGYITEADSVVLQRDLSGQNFRIVRTIFTVDNEHIYFAIVAIRTAPVLNNSDINKARADGNNIEIYFNLGGATKWADLTKKNIGKPVAFIINNRIYAMPQINAEIRNGMAVINGISNDSKAQEIAEAIVMSDE